MSCCCCCCCCCLLFFSSLLLGSQLLGLLGLFFLLLLALCFSLRGLFRTLLLLRTLFPPPLGLLGLLRLLFFFLRSLVRLRLGHCGLGVGRRLGRRLGLLCEAGRTLRGLAGLFRRRRRRCLFRLVPLVPSAGCPGVVGLLVQLLVGRPMVCPDDVCRRR